MYLNSLGNVTDNEMLFFADDSSIIAKHDSENFHAVIASLQKDIDAIEDYGRRWIITFNASKTSQQTFSKKRAPDIPELKFGVQPIPLSEHRKHLGLTFSTDLRFKHHINDILLKFNRALSPLYSIASEIPRNLLLTIYKIYVQPHLDYCATVYDGHITVFDRSRLEKAQNRAARLITGIPRRISTSGLLKELGWSTLASRRQSQKLLLYQKLRFDNSVPVYIKDIIPNTRKEDMVRELRSSRNEILTEPPVHTDSYRRSFTPSTAKQWNEMPLELRHAAANSVQFKKHVRRTRTPKPASPYYSLGSKIGNILHTRLRLNSSHLKAHMYAQGKAESPHCSCGYPREDTQHYLLCCPLHILPRINLFQKLSNTLHIDFSGLPRPQQIKYIIEGPNGSIYTKIALATAVQNFLLDTSKKQ